MKKLFLPLLVICFIETACETNETNNEKLLYEKTELGGCNNIKTATTRSYNSKTETFDNDTVIITVAKESVDVFVGINYTCKSTPFETKCEITDNVVCMYIIDICNDNSENCYYRCSCYYTFDFIFKREQTAKLNQKYKVLLIDPKEEEPVLISEGIITDNE